MPEKPDDKPRPEIEADEGEEASKPKKVGTRRVAGWSTSDRLLARHHRRPAGNSRSFWSRIEEDDPFARRRSRQARNLSDHDLYPAQRLSRVEDGRVVSSRPVSPRPPADTPPVPRREAKKRTEAPPQKAHSPEEAPPTAPSRVKPTPQSASPPPIDRRPPLIREGHKSKSGRMRVARTQEEPPQGHPSERKSAAQIREEKLTARTEEDSPKPPKIRGLDNILGLLGDLSAASSVFDENQKRKERGEELLPEAIVNHDPRPGPGAPPKAKGRDKHAAPKPTATPHTAEKAEPVAQELPAKAPKKSDPRVNRSPSGGGMDDLFGGGPQEGRVRIGKRTKK